MFPFYDHEQLPPIFDIPFTPSKANISTPHWAAFLALSFYPESKRNQLVNFENTLTSHQQPLRYLLETLKPVEPADNMATAVARVASNDLEHFQTNHAAIIEQMRFYPHFACIWAEAYIRAKNTFNTPSFETIIHQDDFKDEYAVMSKYYLISKNTDPHSAPKMDSDTLEKVHKLIKDDKEFVAAIDKLNPTTANKTDFLTIADRYNNVTHQNKKQKVKQ